MIMPEAHAMQMFVSCKKNNFTLAVSKRARYGACKLFGKVGGPSSFRRSPCTWHIVRGIPI
jgi:hypothetical protein